jgi:predicted nucleic acid-binding protein
VVAADTNVVVRLLVQDDPGQGLRATNFFRDEEIWICKTVLLETAWVLSSLYGFDPANSVAALRALAGLPNVRIENETEVAAAFDLCNRGIELADALHLTSRGLSIRFASFDARFVRRARAAGVKDVRLV